MLKKIVVPILLLLSLTSFAQNEETSPSDKPERPKSPFWEKVFVGGNIGAQFGNVTVVNLSPIVGYRFTPKISAGFGITYQYYSIKTYNYETHMYGGRIFGRYQPLSFLFLHAEAEAMNWNCPRNEPTGFTTERLWSPGLLAGGGLTQSIGDGGSAIYIMGLYNFLYNDCSPYGSPIVLRIGANFGL
jgi:hypothetical protein